MKELIGFTILSFCINNFLFSILTHFQISSKAFVNYLENKISSCPHHLNVLFNVRNLLASNIINLRKIIYSAREANKYNRSC